MKTQAQHPLVEHPHTGEQGSPGVRQSVTPGAPGMPAASRWFRNRAQTRCEVLVIIGNGPAGFRLCEKLAARASTSYRIVVFGEETTPAYDRVRLTRLLSGTPLEELLLAGRDWYNERGIELHTGDPVVAVDRSRRIVRSASGKEIPYDKLVFATGSRPFIPPLPGHDLRGVFPYRTAEDLQQIRAHAAGRTRAAVIGGGLLGLEAASALSRLELETWIVERRLTPLARHLPPEAGRFLRSLLEKENVRILPQRDTEGIQAEGDDLLLHFTSGEILRVQCVVMATGVRPRDELATACGLPIGKHGGITINDSLQTDDPNVFAIGECACHRGVIHGLAAPSLLMAEVLADRLCGRNRRFTGADASTWLKVPGIEVSILGEYQANAETLTFRSDSSYRQILVQGRELIGAVTVGNCPEQRQIHAAIVQKRRIWGWQRTRFLRAGRLWVNQPPRSVTEWPATALVCNCRGVTRGALGEACAAGCRTVEQLARATGASTVCGSCAPLLAELLGAPARPARLPGTPWLVAGSVAAAAAILGLALLPPMGFSSTLADASRLEVLWRNPVARQVTGYIALGLMLLSMIFSLRKRVRRLATDKLTVWRALHGCLGALTLVALATHTGIRLGQNFNRILMLNVLILALAGSFAGLVTAFESRSTSPFARQLRAIWTRTHLLLSWPLPLLILVHVLTAYYF